MIKNQNDFLESYSKRFEEHYGFKISPTTVDRVTMESALGCQVYVEKRLQSKKEYHSHEKHGQQA